MAERKHRSLVPRSPEKNPLPALDALQQLADLMAETAKNSSEILQRAKAMNEEAAARLAEQRAQSEEIRQGLREISRENSIEAEWRDIPDSPPQLPPPDKK